MFCWLGLMLWLLDISFFWWMRIERLKVSEFGQGAGLIVHVFLGGVRVVRFCSIAVGES
jgi:hypothetical protein